MKDLKKVSLTVNGERYERTVESRLSLADFLRHELGLTGTHIGCEHGVCGACTVLVGGRTARACLMLAAQADGQELQCGFCTPGVLMTLTELLAEKKNPTEAEVRDALSGHLCRCTGYHNIVAAALEAAKK